MPFIPHLARTKDTNISFLFEIPPYLCKPYNLHSHTLHFISYSQWQLHKTCTNIAFTCLIDTALSAVAIFMLLTCWVNVATQTKRYICSCISYNISGTIDMGSAEIMDKTNDRRLK